ncbi:MAG: hypothetical protein U0694_23130 [Anaerolineae bacterium]
MPPSIVPFTVDVVPLMTTVSLPPPALMPPVTTPLLMMVSFPVPEPAALSPTMRRRAVIHQQITTKSEIGVVVAEDDIGRTIVGHHVIAAAFAKTESA